MKGKNTMSKAIGRIYGVGSRSPYGYETDYMKYLQGYNPYDYEQTLRNMSQSYADVRAKPEYNLNTAMQGNDYSLKLPEFVGSENYIAENKNMARDVIIDSYNNKKVDFDDIYYSRYDENGNRLYKGIAEEEGKYSDRSVDTPTNYGVTQAALDEYNAWNSSLRTMYNLPSDVKYLNVQQAKNIMEEMYHKRYSIDKIQKLPIAANVTDHIINGGTDANWLLADTVNDYKQLSYPRNIIISDKLAAVINDLQDNEIIPFNDLYTQRRMDRYFRVIDNKPEKINNLNGWYDRIKKFHSSQDEFDRLYKSKKEDYFRKYKSFYTGK